VRLRFALAAAAAMLPPAAAAQDSEAGRNLAASCAICHGTDGRSVSPELPSLAGLPRERIVLRMQEFRDGRREATVMHQIAKAYDDRQIERLAAYFAAQKP
jgi:cytochrome c553